MLQLKPLVESIGFAAEASDRGSLKAASTGAALAVLLGGCVFVPQTLTEYDPQCRLRVKRMELKVAAPRGFMPASGCQGEACAAVLVTAGVVTAGSLAISGSIVVVGNVAYWVEKQGRCLRGQIDEEEAETF